VTLMVLMWIPNTYKEGNARPPYAMRQTERSDVRSRNDDDGCSVGNKDGEEKLLMRGIMQKNSPGSAEAQ